MATERDARSGGSNSMADDPNLRSPRSHDPLGRTNAPSGSGPGGNDPLAELARLIGQHDPFADFGRDGGQGDARKAAGTLDWRGESARQDGNSVPVLSGYEDREHHAAAPKFDSR